MPDNQTHDWTADEDFWDDAWADMNARLDQTDRRPARWPWLLLAAVLTGGLFLVSHYATSGATTPPTAAVVADATPNAAAGSAGGDLIPVPPTAAAATPPAGPAADRIKSRTARLPRASARRSTTPSAPTFVDSTASVYSVVESADATVAPPPTVPSGPADRPILTPDVTDGTRRSAIAPLPLRDPQRLVRRPTLPLFPAPHTPVTRRTEWNLTAAALAQPGVPSPGYALGVGLARPLSDRFALTAGVAYQRADYRLSLTPAAAEDGGAAEDSTSLAAVVDRAGASEDLLVRNSTLQLALGASYRIGRRWQVAAGVNYGYLFGARLRLPRSLGSDFAADPNGFNALDLANSATSTDQLFSSSGRFFGSGVNTSYRRGLIGARVGLSYRLTDRLAVDAAYQTVLQQPDRAQITRITPGQLSIGLRWRLR